LLNLIIFIKYLLLLLILIYIYINIFFFFINFLILNKNLLDLVIFLIISDFEYELSEFFKISYYFLIFLKPKGLEFKDNSKKKLPSLINNFELLNVFKLFFFEIRVFFLNLYFFKFGFKKNYFINFFLNKKKKFTN
jgi:hypothetical protein